MADIIKYSRIVVFIDRKINVLFWRKRNFDDSEIGWIVTRHELTDIKFVISTLWYILLRKDCIFYKRGDVISTQESTVPLLRESHTETINVTRRHQRPADKLNISFVQQSWFSSNLIRQPSKWSDRH